jgi:hypothetical protein
MKTWTSTLAAGAIFVFAALPLDTAAAGIPADPTGNGALGGVTTALHLAAPAHGNDRPSVALLAANKLLLARNSALAARNKALLARNKALSGASVPHVSRPPSIATANGAYACLASLTSCTDAQACAEWGANCDLVGSHRDGGSAIEPAAVAARGVDGTSADCDGNRGC